MRSGSISQLIPSSLRPKWICILRRVSSQRNTPANLPLYGTTALLKTLLKETADLYGIVFVKSKIGVSRLAHKLRQRFPVNCVHGGMEQRDRDIVLDGFRNREYKLLVATDILSRGIDIAELTTRSYAAAHTGAPMFSVQMTVYIPARIHVSALREEFMDLCDHMNLDAILEPAKP